MRHVLLLLQVKGSLDALSARGSGGSVLVVGAGYSGVELAATMAERLKDSSVAVQLVTPGYDLLEGSPEGQQQAARQALGALGVQLITGGSARECDEGFDVYFYIPVPDMGVHDMSV